MAVGKNQLQKNAVDARALADDAVDAGAIAAGAVAASEIATDGVGSAEIAADAVGSSEIAAGAVGTSEIAANSVAMDDVVRSDATGKIIVGQGAGADSVYMSLQGDGSIDGGGNFTLAEDTIKRATATLTAVQVKALATTPIQLVAAPGAGKAIQFLGAVLKMVYGSEVFAEAGDNLGIKYTDASGVQVSDTIEMTNFIDQAANTYTNAVPVKDAIVAATAIENQALVLDNLNANFSGNASNDGQLIVSVAYRVVTLA